MSALVWIPLVTLYLTALFVLGLATLVQPTAETASVGAGNRV